MCNTIAYNSNFIPQNLAMEKSAGILLEFKDLNISQRTGVIRHSVYNSIDKVGDISHKGMFTKSWNESKPKIHINHDAKQIPGTTIRTWDDDTAGFTEMKFGTWTLGNDALEMASEGIFTGASFGYVVQKKDYSEVKGRKIRNLREVKHIETSLLTVEAAHDGAGLVSLVKSLDEIADDQITELLTWGNEHITSLKSYVQKIENYCRKAKASDETIISLQNGLIEYKQIISSYDTALTSLATKPDASDDGIVLTNFINHLKIETWKKQSLSNSMS